MKTLYESLLDIDAQIENELNEFLVLYNASDEQNYKHILTTLLDGYKKIKAIKILDVGFDWKLKKNTLYLALYPSKSNKGPIFIGTMDAKSKIVSMRWGTARNKVIAVTHHSSIANVHNPKEVEWYEIPSDKLKDFEEFKTIIKQKIM